MKLIVAGMSGFISKEIIRQSLSRKEITSVVALARKPVLVPDDLANVADPSKLRSVGIKNYEQYTDNATKEFAGSSALDCVKRGRRRRSRRGDDVRLGGADAPVSDLHGAGMNAIYEAGPAKPFRFLYASGETAERDQTKKPSLMAKYTLMRVEVESQVIKFAAEHEGVEAAVAKLALIYASIELLKTIVFGPLARLIIGAPSISTIDLAKAMLDQVISGFEKNPLQAMDLVRLSEPTTA
ncbi:NAD(P)-binding protein [Xylariaceae sp. FL0662B]|nr:NAD(P)-binding protein [Xylariaceae sp. FL0662B]